MKVASWETFVVGNPPPSEGGNYFIFVKLVTDDGLVDLLERIRARNELVELESPCPIEADELRNIHRRLGRAHLAADDALRIGG